MGKSISKNVCGTCSERLQTLNLEEKEQKLQENEFTLNGQTFRELSILEILKGKDYSTRATTDYTSERSLNSMEKPKIQKPKFKAAKPL